MRLRTERLEDRTVPTVLPAGFAEAAFGGTLTAPTALALLPDGRALIAEQGGTLRVAVSDTIQTAPVLTVAVDAAGERGLLGVAPDPAFAENGFIYVYYTVPRVGATAARNRISRFTMTGNTAANESVLVSLDPLSGATNHNGGAVAFGPDGKLYVAVGDNAEPANAQSLTTRHGKILRYNADGTIPADNPSTFDGIAGTTADDDRAIFAVGFRNPFTFGFHPTSGLFFANDVGQDRFEEVNRVLVGNNYGWPGTEGEFDPTAFPDFTAPVEAYPHGAGTAAGFAVAGAAFYAPLAAVFPADYVGDYFYADFANGWIRRLDTAGGESQLFASDLTTGSPVDLDVTVGGNLLVLARGDGSANDGRVYRISFTQAPQISVPPQNVSVAPGSPATFAVTATGAEPFTYRWQRNGTDISGATGPTYTLANPQEADDGAQFRVTVTNAFGVATSAAATLTVSFNRAPVPVIGSPAAGTRFTAGQTFDFAGSATDEEDGPLAAAALTWRVEYLTGAAPPRPFVPDTVGNTGTFTIPTVTPYTAADVLYRVVLTATDSEGQSATVTRDLTPVVGSVTLLAPVGAALTLDGQPAPVRFSGVAGVQRALAAAATYTAGGMTYTFTGWSDDAAAPRERTLSTPAGAATITAQYEDANGNAPGVTVPVYIGEPGLVRAVDPETGAELRRFDLTTALPAPNVPFTAEARVAVADVTGDGVADLIVGAGPGTPTYLVVYDGASGAVIVTTTVFEAAFTGGVFVAAADLTGDGKAEVIVSPDVGGGPRVKIVSGTNPDAVVTDYFGIDDPNFRGGARVSAGDVSGDGTPDVLVAAGTGGGPRLAAWDGKGLAAGAFTRVFADFFVFEQTLRNGVYIAAGDLTGDGVADLIVGGGPGGGPRVFALSGRDLRDANAQTVIANFFAAEDALRDGVRVGVKDLDSGLVDILAAPVGGPVRGYSSTDLALAGTPDPLRIFEASSAGVYVG